MTHFHVDIHDQVADLVVRAQVGDFRQATKNTILSTRGWVLQEQLLSPRMISCMSSDFHWECMKMHQTEAGAQWTLNGSNIRGTSRSHWRYSALFAASDVVELDAKLFQRNFTSWRDRVPALCGITQSYQSLTGDTPLLGLWRRSLLEDLLWIR